MTASVEPQRGNQLGSRLGSLLLNVAAFGGLVCIVLVALSFFFDITLIMFKTGSMSPTIPAGSVAVVREISASEVNVGDVVTVERPEALPVTHRVVEIAEGANSTTARALTLKGDANEAEDAAPYLVEQVRLVLFALPGVATFVVWLANPVVLGAITIGASLLVTWAFWPREPKQPRTPRGEQRSSAPQAPPSTLDAVPPGVAAAAPHPPTPSQVVGTVLSALIAAGIVIAPIAAPTSARASTSEQLTEGAQLRLASIGDPEAMGNLLPGHAVQWQVGVWAAASEIGTIDLTLVGTGSASLALQATVRSCEQRWVDGRCPSGSTELMPSHSVPVDGQSALLTSFASNGQRWLLFEIWTDAGTHPDAVTPHGSVDLAIHAVGFGDELTTSPGVIGPLSSTGASPLAPILGAVGAVGSGLLLAGLAHLSRAWRNRAALHALRGTPT